MALDTRLPLMDISPDSAGSVMRGFGLGTQLAQARQIGQQREMQMDEQRKANRQNDMITAFSVVGDYDPLAVEPQMQEQAYLGAMNSLREAGVELDDDDLTFTPENALQLKRAIDTGGKLYSQQQASATNANRVVNTAELGGGAMQITYADGRTEVVTPTAEQRAQIEAAQAANIKYESDLNQARGFGRKYGETVAALEQADDVAAKEALAAAEKARAEGDVRAEQAADIKFEESIGGEAGKIYSSANASAQQASRILPDLYSLKSAVQEVDTGGWTPFATKMKRFFGADVADEETLNSRLMGLAQDVLNQQTGTKTDFDFQVAVEQVASLGKTREANERLIDLLIERNMKHRDFGDQVKEAYKSGGAKAVIDMRYSPAGGDLDNEASELGI